MKHLLIALTLLATPALGAMREGPGHGSGPAHPSAFLCQELGGKTLFATAPNGTIHECQLGEAKISPMSLWMFSKGHVELSVKAYLAHPMPRPGVMGPAAYCRQLGGEPRSMISYDGKLRSDSCVFNENGHLSTIDQRTLLNGPRYAGNAWLTRLLTNK